MASVSARPVEDSLIGLWKINTCDDAMQIQELSLVEANQMSMAQMAGNMPGLSSLKHALEESNWSEDQLSQEEMEASEVIPPDFESGVTHDFTPEKSELTAGMRFKKTGKKGKYRPSTDS